MESWDQRENQSENRQLMTREVKVAQSCPTLCNPRDQTVPWNSSGQNMGVGRCSLPQGIFPTQGLSPDLPHCAQILYQLSHQWSPRILEWVAYPFSRGSYQPRNWTGVSCIAGRFFTSWATREAFLQGNSSPGSFHRTPLVIGHSFILARPLGGSIAGPLLSFSLLISPPCMVTAGLQLPEF